ncbi:MAG: hypothetical protein AAGA85_12180 [Bacteroidota bacterium]
MMNDQSPTVSKWRTHDFHKFWLKITAFVVASFGPVFFLGTMQGTLEPARWTLDFLSWPVDGSATFAAGETRFISALVGGFLMGWGATIWLLSTHVYDKAPEGTRKAVLIGLLFWFVFDSAGSITSGFPSNAFFNLLILLIGVGPLWRSAAD